jgi:hypothetical protein
VKPSRKHAHLVPRWRAYTTVLVSASKPRNSIAGSGYPGLPSAFALQAMFHSWSCGDRVEAFGLRVLGLGFSSRYSEVGQLPVLCQATRRLDSAQTNTDLSKHGHERLLPSRWRDASLLDLLAQLQAQQRSTLTTLGSRCCTGRLCFWAFRGSARKLQEADDEGSPGKRNPDR